MQYHIDMITYGMAFLDQLAALVGQLNSMWKNSTFLKQMDRAGLEPGGPAWQTEMLTIMLYPYPSLSNSVK